MIKSSEINRKRLDWLLDQSIDVQATMLSQHFEICRMLINSILEEEVQSYAGQRYQRDRPNGGRYYRHGFNRGSVRLGSQKVKVAVPRIYDNEEESCVALSSYDQFQSLPHQGDQELNAVLKGLSTRDYGSVIQTLADSFGLSSSTVSRKFIEESKQRLEAFEQRKLEEDYVALFVDGKQFAGQQMVIVLGITIKGDKVPLGLIQTTTENSQSIAELFRELISRGLEFEEGLLVIIDGGKGLRKAVNDVFGNRAFVQRCQWHKRENVVSYLADSQQDIYRKKLQSAYSLDDYQQAKDQLMAIKNELSAINRSAARSLEEGFEETLTLKRLKLSFLFHRSFSTTNCIENLNAQLVKYTHKVKRWMNSEQRHRWVICGLMEVETRMRKVANYKHLHQMKQKLKEETELLEKENQIKNKAA